MALAFTADIFGNNTDGGPLAYQNEPTHYQKYQGIHDCNLVFSHVFVLQLIQNAAYRPPGLTRRIV